MGYLHEESTFAEKVRDELEAARVAHPVPLRSAHEAYAVIMEELDEVWAVIRLKRHGMTDLELAAELVQVAAMCQRAAEDLNLPVVDVLHRHRFVSDEAYAAAKVNRLRKK